MHKVNSTVPGPDRAWNRKVIRSSLLRGEAFSALIKHRPRRTHFADPSTTFFQRSPLMNNEPDCILCCGEQLFVYTGRVLPKYRHNHEEVIPLLVQQMSEGRCKAGSLFFI
jgi:hypothetical protein